MRTLFLSCAIVLSTTGLVLSQSTTRSAGPSTRTVGPSTRPTAISKAKPAKDTIEARVMCAGHMKQIHMGAILYSNAQAGLSFPPDLATLYSENDGIIDPDVFLCPDSTAKVPANWSGMDLKAKAAWVAKNSSYVYEGKGLTSLIESPDIILLSEKPGAHNKGVNVLFTDGHPEFVTTAKMPAARKKSDAARKAAK